MSAKLRQKARDLIELAVNEGTTDKERVTAAMQAVKIIRTHDLLASPLDFIDSENETVSAAKSILEVLTDPKLTANVKKVASRFRR